MSKFRSNTEYRITVVDRDKLLEKVKSFPSSPGVYLIKDEHGIVLYVGKSVSLRDRVLSYFRGGEDARTNIVVMMDKVVDVDCVQTPSEIDALLAEQRLIKDLSPKYNVDLKDDKSYPYLEIRKGGDFPQVLISRDIKPGSRVYGPFTDPAGLHAAYLLLQRIFRFRVCSGEVREDPSKRRRPCLYHYIGSCLGPCGGRVAKVEYAKAIRRLRQFLEGKSMVVMKEVRAEMEAAAQDFDFERAAVLRDQLQALESLSSRALMGDYRQVGSIDFNPIEGLEALADALDMDDVPRMIEGIDIATIHGKQSVGSIVTFVDGRPFKDGYRKYKIKTVKGVDDYAMVREVVMRRYRRLKEEEGILPHVLLVDGGPGQLKAALEGLEAAGARPVKVVSLAKREELVFVEGRREPLEFARTSAALKVLQAVRDEAHRFAQHYHHVLRGRSLFGAKASRITRSARRAKWLKRRGTGSENA